jgi:hypothetical protein
VCGLVLTGLTAGGRALDRRLGAGGRISRIPPGVPAGLAVALGRDRVRRTPSVSADERVAPPALPSIGASVGVVGLLARFAALDHVAAGAGGRGAFPGAARPAPGMAACRSRWVLGLVVAAGTAVFDRIVRELEAGATAFEPMLPEAVEPGWLGPTISGGPGSRIPWATLGREGRRHAVAYVHARSRSTTGLRVSRT